MVLAYFGSQAGNAEQPGTAEVVSRDEPPVDVEARFEALVAAVDEREHGSAAEPDEAPVAEPAAAQTAAEPAQTSGGAESSDPPVTSPRTEPEGAAEPGPRQDLPEAPSEQEAPTTAPKPKVDYFDVWG
jgi:hypothetical protein